MSKEETKNIELVGNYKIAIGRDKDVLVSIPMCLGMPEKAAVIYDGGDHALLRRNQESEILLDYVSPEFKYYAPRNLNVYVAEFNGDFNDFSKMRWTYGAPIEMEAKLPVSYVPRAKDDVLRELEEAKANGTLDKVASKIAEEFSLFDDETIED